jgi:hypothetical protein
LLVVTFVHVSDRAGESSADELSFGAALMFIAACLLSHRSISKEDDRYERIADKVFAAALLLLLFGVLSFWF